MKSIAVLVYLLAFASSAAQARALQHVAPYAAPSTLALQDLNGKPHTLAAYKGKVVLVNFWATWCPPCRAEMPSIQRLKARMTGKPFAVLAVNMAESQADIRTFLKAMQHPKLDFTILMDKDGKALKTWNVFVFPTSFVLDAGGKVRYSLIGSTEWDAPDTMKQIEALLPSPKLKPAPGQP